LIEELIWEKLTNSKNFRTTRLRLEAEK
jgi:hypothetical protein